MAVVTVAAAAVVALSREDEDELRFTPALLIESFADEGIALDEDRLDECSEFEPPEGVTIVGTPECSSSFLDAKTGEEVPPEQAPTAILRRAGDGFAFDIAVYATVSAAERAAAMSTDGPHPLTGTEMRYRRYANAIVQYQPVFSEELPVVERAMRRAVAAK